MPFEGWPQLFNPPPERSSTPITPSFPVFPIGSASTIGDTGPAYSELLGAKPLHDIDSMAAIQMDIQAVHARDLVPFLLRLQPETAVERQALELLKGWDFAAHRDRPEPLILDWWLRRMNEHLLKSGLDSVAPMSGALNASVVAALLRRPDGFCRTEEADPTV